MIELTEAAVEILALRFVYEERLDKLWAEFIDGNDEQKQLYQSVLDFLEAIKINVIRNKKGKHKISLNI